MRTPATIPPVLPSGPTGPAARSGAPPGDTPFAAFLENDRARTAVAEGPNKSDTPSETRPADRRPSGDDRSCEARAETPAPSDDAPVAEERPAETPAPEADPTLASPVPAAVPVALPAPLPGAPVVAVATEVVTTTQTVAAPVPVTAETTTAVAVPQAQPAAATTTGPAQAAPVAETTPAPVQPVATATGEAAAPQDGEAAPTTQTATPGDGELPSDDGQQPGRREDARTTVPQQRPAGEHAAQRPVAPVQQAVTAEPTATATEAPRASEVTTSATPAPAPAAPPSGMARGAVPLEHAQRTVEAALQLAAQRGWVTRARLQLHPAELGAIEIHLRQSANGVSARLVADSPEALQLLQQNGNDLRRSLESAGIDVLGLDIGARGDDRRADQGAFAGAANGGSGRSNGGDADAGDDETTTTVSVPTVRGRLPLPGGALLDVLA